MEKYEGSIHQKEFVNSYWCPECGNKINIRTNGWIRFRLEYEQDVEVMCANTDFYALCTKCDCYMIPIDYLLADHIKVLNANGIVTKFCCAGHLNMFHPISQSNSNKMWEYYIDLPYIAFANIPGNKVANDIVKGLLNLQEYGFIEYEENEEQWTIRAKISEIKSFSDARNKFINMVSELIAQLTAGD